MPNQNPPDDQNQNLTTQPDPTGSPPVDPTATPPPISDIPHAPSDFPPTDISTPGPIDAGLPPPPVGSSAPSDDINLPPVVTPPPKKKGINVVATILGVLFLVLATGAGVYLVRQQQELREKAAGRTCTYNGSSGSCKAACDSNTETGAIDQKQCPPVEQSGAYCCVPKAAAAPSTCNSGETCRSVGAGGCFAGESSTGKTCSTVAQGICCAKTTTTTSCSSGETCRSAGAPGPNGKFGCAGWDETSTGKSCSTVAQGTCCVKLAGGGGAASPSPSPTAAKGDCGATCKSDADCVSDLSCAGYLNPPVCWNNDKTQRCGGGGGGGITARCLNIIAYSPDDTWRPVANLSGLAAGMKVRFAVAGNTTSGNIDNARFTITEGTAKKGPFTAAASTRPGQAAGTKEFYYEYTMPEGVTGFSIKAELHHTDSSIGVGGWF